MIIDFHSHVLPGIDDGSDSVETSMEMLRTARKQKIEVMVATPHFYAHRTNIDDFLKARAAAYESIRAYVEEYYYPEVLLGAEILFFPGISRTDEIAKLCIEDTDILLIEMPFEQWTEKTIAEIDALLRKGFTVVIAHLERYLAWQKDKNPLQTLLDLPVYIQINAESLLHWGSRRMIFPLFENGHIHLLGSDCHNLIKRPENLEEGREVLKQLEKKSGREILRGIDETAKELLGYY